MFGAPGVGKGTQGKVLGGLPGFLHISSGDMFRAIDAESELGGEVHRYTARGELVPDDLTVRLWRSAVDEHIAEGRYRPESDMLILDGIPRNVRQSELLERLVNVLCVIHLEASNIDEMVRRMKRRALKENRVDDADEKVIRRRFDVYRRESAPVLDYYPADVRCTVDALRSPAEVLRSVLDCVIAVQNEYFQSRRR